MDIHKKESSNNVPQSVSTKHLQTLKKEEVECRMKKELENLLKNCPDSKRDDNWAELESFLGLFQKYLAKRGTTLQWNEIEDLPPGTLLDYKSFSSPPANAIKRILNKLVVIKLNGGLGTTMHCTGPKSVIPVKNELTLLDLTVQSLENLNSKYGTNIPLVLMNSFNTKDVTENMIKKYQNLHIRIYTFTQSMYPRFYADNFSPLPQTYDDSNETAWYPPGHGNFYEAFHKSGLIKMFLEEDREFCFISNIDNLGATVDFDILNHMVNPNSSPAPTFVIEVTDKTLADVKGGTLIYLKGKLRLLEYNEVPKEHLDEFRGVRKFNIFNTNNLWIKLDTISNLVVKKSICLGVIGNRKQLNTERGETEVIQLETAIGAAIESFPTAAGVVVPRNRFLPVKTTSDLFTFKSNAYIFENGVVAMNPLRSFPFAPLVHLENEFFGDYRSIEKRFENMPDCLELHHLTVSGDVSFGKDVSFKGNVTIVADNKERINIPQGSVLEGKIVTGCLRIVDY